MDDALATVIVAAVGLIGGLAGARIGSKATAKAATIAAAATVATKRYDGRQPAYHALTTSLNQFRHSLEANDVVPADLKAADQRVHDVVNEVSREGPPEVAEIAKEIRDRCWGIRLDTEPGRRGPRLGSRDERVEAWQTQIVPLRDDLDEAIFKHGI
ncbi:hypothetical protein [Streptomyces sp. NPDC002685]|uniref:hypothetical protein n=1 Tax=Streptomyces sp. NPDC002685 TaxID=3154540 RepID=UPI00331BA844